MNAADVKLTLQGQAIEPMMYRGIVERGTGTLRADISEIEEWLDYMRSGLSWSSHGGFGVPVERYISKQAFENVCAAARRDDSRRGAETAWLIERTDIRLATDAYGPLYWAGGVAWAHDHMLAIRLARREDAVAVAGTLGLPAEVLVIVEHRWCRS